MSDMTEDLSGQIFGLLVSLCVVALFIVWVINTPPLVPYGVTGLNVIIIASWAVSSIRKKSRLNKIRANQVNNHVTDK